MSSEIKSIAIVIINSFCCVYLWFVIFVVVDVKFFFFFFKFSLSINRMKTMFCIGTYRDRANYKSYDFYPNAWNMNSVFVSSLYLFYLSFDYAAIFSNWNHKWKSSGSIRLAFRWIWNVFFWFLLRMILKNVSFSFHICDCHWHNDKESLVVTFSIEIAFVLLFFLCDFCVSVNKTRKNVACFNIAIVISEWPMTDDRWKLVSCKAKYNANRRNNIEMRDSVINLMVNERY